LANPCGLILSSAMLLQWLGNRDQNPGLIQAADVIESTVYRTLEFRGRSQDLGGSLGTRELTDTMLMELQNS